MSPEATTTQTSTSSPLPRVTQILREAGLVSTEWLTEESREKGSALHQATRFLDENDLAWDSVDPEIIGRLRQYQKFLDEVRPEILAIEKEVVNEALQYAGRLDRLVKINGSEGILDLKGPMEAAWQALQCSLYAGCILRPMRRWTLHLSDERYRLIEHKGRDDWSVAKAAITLAAWRRKNGLESNPEKV